MITLPAINVEKHMWFSNCSSDILNKLIDWVVKPLWGVFIAKLIDLILRKRRSIQRITIIEELVNREQMDSGIWKRFKGFADQKENILMKIAFDSSEPSKATLLEVK